MLQKDEQLHACLAGDPEKRFSASFYKFKRPLAIRKNKKIIGLKKNELGGKILKEFETKYI